LGEQAGFDLTGPTTCRVIGEAERETVLAKLGPDPLDPKADAGRAFEKIKKSSREVGGLILDQAVIAGIGNIYRAEILFELGLDPTRPGTSISREEFDAIWETTVRLMKVGVKYRKIITVSREEAGVPLSRIPGRERTRIYKKRRCLTCDDPIKCWEQANRKMYACPSCQGMS
ncbi:MAG: Fpg/Nei family DNA glycosylase, partial [Planctomycetota bacterium]